MISFQADMTLRWPCREGDYMVWARFQGLSGNGYTVGDIWKLRDGDFVTITNRIADLPVGFDLHPTEVSESLVWWMQRRIDEGYRPEGVMESSNLWRVFAGDRVVWVGTSRGGFRAEDGVLELVTFRENALVYGEPLRVVHGLPLFGWIQRDDASPEAAALTQAGWKAVNGLGLPRVVDTDGQWRLG